MKSNSTSSLSRKERLPPSLFSSDPAYQKQAHRLTNYLRDVKTSSRNQKEKVVVIMGATANPKSRLSMELATRFQVYKELDTVTNKVTEEECGRKPHHLLGIIDRGVDFSAADFSLHASAIIESMNAKHKLGGIGTGKPRLTNSPGDVETFWHDQKEKVVIVMGATASGKSRLQFSGEMMNTFEEGIDEVIDDSYKKLACPQLLKFHRDRERLLGLAFAPCSCSSN